MNINMPVSLPDLQTMDAPDYFADRSINDVAKALRAGSVTSRELVEQTLQRIERLNPILNCFASVDHEGARSAAGDLDQELTTGADRGPLHGIPVAIKDIIDVAEQITTSGSALFQGRVAESDATCVARLRAAGAIVIGKTVLHEFAYGITGDRSFHGPSRNPHNLVKMSGGSSGGSAVAVAAGLVPLALGTDTAGSVRVPAALCGVVGYKPAYDAIPTEGVYPLAASLDHVGLVTQSANDAKLAYEILADQVLPKNKGEAEGRRLGWVVPSTFGTIEAAIENDLLRLLAGCGFELVPVTLEEGPALFEILTIVQSSEAYLAHVDDLRTGSSLIDDEVLQRLRAGANVPAWEYLRATQARQRLRQKIMALFETIHLLAMPTVPMVAPDIGERSPRIGGALVEVRSALLSLTSPWNLIGIPAISIPAGTMAGLPFGLQLICPPGSERRMFDVARKVESRMPRKQRPI
jgi:aspartyl-tRNA(Asn)/glutamyl-tRNA(Gln) amidotransferase subunit A